MKMSKKILGAVLAVCMLFASVPFTVSAVEAGTIENPTAGFSFGTSYVRENESGDSVNFGKINTSVKDTSYGFMQTVDNEYFTFTPVFSIQKNPGGAMAVFNSLKLFFGGHYEGAERVEEYPTVETNHTADFVNTYGAAFSWIPSNNNAQTREEAKAFPNDGETDNGGFGLDGTIADLAGCRVYTWDNAIVFHGNTGENFDEISTGFYWNLSWTYADNAWIASHTDREIRIGVRVNVTDCRALLNAIAEAESTLANPGTHTQVYISALKAAVNSVPADMKNASAYYTQEAVDAYTAAIESANDDLADYTEYNKTFEYANSITNESGIYTTDSFSAFKNTVSVIDAGLSKSLNSEDQATVDEAEAALKGAVGSIISNPVVKDTMIELGDQDTAKIRASLEAARFCFMQIFDNQLFTVNQNFYTRKYGDSTAYFNSLLLDMEAADACTDSNCIKAPEAAENTTSSFLESVKSPIATDENGNKAFASWVLNSETTGSSDFVSDGKLCNTELTKGGFLGMGNYNIFSADSTIVFAGSGADDAGETETGYAYRAEWTYNSAVYHGHFNTVINITDARALNSKYCELTEFMKNTAQNEAEYTSDSLAAINEALAATPADMAYGTAYYSQEDVDAALAVLTSAENGLAKIADYSGFDSAVDEAQTIISYNNLDGIYPEDKFELFKNTVSATISGLDRDLPITSQGNVDEATAAVEDAMRLLRESEYCNYSELQAAITYANGVFDEGGYTDASADALTEALAAAADLPSGMLKGADDINQKAIDAATEALIAAAAGAVKKADYSEYNEKKNNLDSVTNTDNRYDPEDFDTFKDTVAALDEALDKDLSDTEENQKAIDDAIIALEQAGDALEASKHFFVKCYDENSNLVDTVRTKTAAFSELSLPEIPSDTLSTAYCGWRTADDSIIDGSFKVAEDINIYLATEDKVLLPKEDSSITVDEGDGFLTGISDSSTVSEVLSKIDNDERVVEIHSFDGVLLGASDMVGTGATITVRSKYTSGKIYSTDTVIITGDVNGDGIIDELDENIAVNANLGSHKYSDSEKCFSTANDINGDGVLDVFDTFYIRLLADR